MKKRVNNKTAKVMIGIIDIDSIQLNQRGKVIEGNFCLLPYFGYGFNGINGKKYHIDKTGKSYSNRYKIGDVIIVELNRTQNDYIKHNELKFYTNDKVNGMAFNIDNDRNYVLAVSLYDDKYDIQICD